MYSIELSTEIQAPLTLVRAALGTLEGFRAWFAADTEQDAAGHFIFSFGPRVVTFELDRADDRSIAMTCVREQNNPDWLGTKLSITLATMASGKTHVALVHAGYPSKNECYTRCIQGWEYFLSSLALHATTGIGTPFGAPVLETAQAQAAAEVAS